QATVSTISVLARVDFSSGWPPAKNFDLILSITDADARLRPGMSAVARIAVGTIPDMLLVPTGAIFPSEGRLMVYRRTGTRFEALPVEIVRRGREQTAVKGPLAPGDHLALAVPAAALLQGDGRGTAHAGGGRCRARQPEWHCCFDQRSARPHDAGDAWPAGAE